MYMEVHILALGERHSISHMGWLLVVSWRNFIRDIGGIKVRTDLRLQIGVTPLVRGWRRSPTTLLANASPWGGSLVHSTVRATVGRQRPKKEVAEVVVCSLWLSTSMWPFHHLLAVDLI